MFEGRIWWKLFSVLLLSKILVNAETNYDELLSWKPDHRFLQDVPELRMKQIQNNAIRMKESFKEIENAQLVKQMLEALETGHNQMISSLNPPKLKELKRREVPSRSSMKDGEYGLINQLDPQLQNKLKEIILSDRRRSPENQILPQCFHKASFSLDDDKIRLLARITPIINVSKKCSMESQFYLENLISNDEHPLWAIKMLDSVAKVVDGLYENSKSLCDASYFCQKYKIEGTNQELVELYESITIPIGNTQSLGDYQECLSVVHHEFVDSNTTFNIIGKYSDVHLIYRGDSTAASEMKPYNLIPYYGGDPQSFARKLAKQYNSYKDETEKVWQKNLTNPIVDDIISKLVGNAAIAWGHCAPSACDQGDFWNNYQALYKDYSLGAYAGLQQTKETQKPEWKDITYLMVVVLGIVALLMIVGTLVDIFQRVQPYPKHYVKGESREDSTMVKVLKCFSVNINGRAVLNTDAAGEGHLTCMNGMRSITMIWVALGHFYLYGVAYAANTQIPIIIRNRGDCEQVSSGQTGNYEIILNALPSVDSFFLMGSTLVSYLTFQQLQKGRFNILLFYIHRYIRLTIPLAFTIGFFAGIVPYLSSGPFFPYFPEIGSPKGCEKYGWLNIVYLNIYNDKIIKEQDVPWCLGQTWYLSTDMQFYWLSPLIILPIWFNVKYGLTWWAIVFATMTGVIGWTTKACNKAPTSISGSTYFENVHYEHRPPSCDSVAISGDFAPFIRAQVYLIGLLFGWILFKIKGKKIKIPHGVNAVMWQVTIVTMALVVFGLHNLRVDLAGLPSPWMYVFPQPISYATTIIYNCFQRVAWSLSLCWVIFSCSKGYGGIVNDFLSWGGFAPISRLTFFMYLIHLDFELGFFMSLDYAYEFSNLQFSIWFIGIMMIIAALAFVATLAFEIPFAKLEAMIIKGIMGTPTKKKITVTKTSSGNEKSTKQEEETAPYTTTEETKEVDDKRNIEVNQRGKKNSFVRSLSRTDFYSKGIDTSNENDLKETEIKNQSVNLENIPSVPYSNNSFNETGIANKAHENVLNVDQQGVKILQTYDSYPDGDVKDTLTSVQENVKKT